MSRRAARNVFEKPSMLTALGARAIREADRNPSVEAPNDPERARFLSLYVEKMHKLVETIATLDHLYFYNSDANCNELYECMNNVSDSENTLQSLERCVAPGVTDGCKLTGGVSAAIEGIRDQIAVMREKDAAGRSMFEEYADASARQSDDTMMADAVADVAEKYIEDLREELRRLNDLLRTASLTHKEHATKVDQITEDLETRVSEKQGTIDKLAKDLEQAQQNERVLKANMAEVQGKLNQAQDEVADMSTKQNALTRELDELRDTCDGNLKEGQVTIDAMREDQEKMESLIANLTAEQADLRATLVEERAEAVQSERKHTAQVEDMTSELARARAELEELRDKLKEGQDAMRRDQQTIAKLTAEQTQLRATVNEAVQNEGEHEAQVEDMTSELARARAELEELRDKLKDRQEAAVEMDAMRETMEARIVGLMQEQEKLRAALSNERAEAVQNEGEYEAQVEDVTSQLARAQAELEELRGAYDIELKEGRQCIQRLQGIAYPQDSRAVFGNKDVAQADAVQLTRGAGGREGAPSDTKRCPKDAPHHCGHWGKNVRAKCIPRPGYNIYGNQEGDESLVAPCNNRTKDQWENDMHELKFTSPSKMRKQCGDDAKHTEDSCGTNSVMDEAAKKVFNDRHGEALAARGRRTRSSRR